MYKCLPLSIGNQYGFVITALFDFSVEWNGGDSAHDIKISYNKPIEEIEKLSPVILTHFGHGIVTINPPFFIKNSSWSQPNDYKSTKCNNSKHNGNDWSCRNR